MDTINSRCKEVTKEYKEKYDKLLSLVDGYEIANHAQNKNMQELSDIITNTKELISESDFNLLKNEQHNIMKDFFRLEQMKQQPYSNESKDFLENKNDVSIKEQSNNNVNKNNLINIKNNLSLDSINDITNKRNTKKPHEIVPLPTTQPTPQPIIINPNDKNYQVLSNYHTSTPQIPSIQIVNVQEAPKCNNDISKPDLNTTITKVLEKSRSEPTPKQISKSKSSPLDTKNYKHSKMQEKIIDNIKNPRIKVQVDKIMKAKKKNPNYFNDFIEDFTLNMKLQKSKKSNKVKKSVKYTPKRKIHSKKCHNVKFIPNINNSSNNHTLF